MTAPVITVTGEAGVHEVAAVLSHHHISAVPVIDASGSVIGIVSEYDLLAKVGKSAADVMSTAVVSVSEDAEIDDVRHLLLDRRIRRLPVLAGGRIVGIVSRADLVAAMATEWVCQACGEAMRSRDRPQRCPRCGTDGNRFVLQEQPPGS